MFSSSYAAPAGISGFITNAQGQLLAVYPNGQVTPVTIILGAPSFGNAQIGNSSLGGASFGAPTNPAYLNNAGYTVTPTGQIYNLAGQIAGQGISGVNSYNGSAYANTLNNLSGAPVSLNPSLSSSFTAGFTITSNGQIINNSTGQLIGQVVRTFA